MSINGAENDEYGHPTEAARAYQQVRRNHPTAKVREEARPSGAERAYAIWEIRQGQEIRLSRDMPNEETAWINANSQLGNGIVKAAS